MKPLSLLFLLFLLTTTLPAQTYFQQDVAYDIKVSLNDAAHELTGQLTLSYTNNAPDALTEIPFHVWPNAFSGTNTAFAKQKLRAGSTEFYFADEDDRGELSGLNFTVDGTEATHQTDAEHPDIVHLELPRALPSGGSITIRTPFRVDIPASFSRLGHVGESYQLTQWYPKPAVYDQQGWHAMPYLDQGEFYSEFGSFRVEITLPENYVVGATGTLVEASERTWLLEKSAAAAAALAGRSDLNAGGLVAEAFPPSAAATKTITYVAERVHDFAWFADKRFKVLHDTLQLGAGTAPVDVWAMFTATEAGLWREATDYLKRSTRFYSEKIGRYPYPQVTGVQSALSAGGGMEYPMITVIGLSYSARALDEVLTHEVGHNWFYGILGSNERADAWMDEGLNSYYEQRYMRRFYEPEQFAVPVVGELDIDQTGYRYLAAQGRDQPPGTDANELSLWNYWIQAYSKPALALRTIEGATGAAQLDAAMRAYYRAFRFKHPQPDDLYGILRSELGNEMADFFATAMETTHVSDWKVRSLRDGHLNLAHSGKLPAPATAQLTDAQGNKVARTQVPGEGGKAPGNAPNATAARLPAADNPLDLNAANNAAGNRRPTLRFGIGDESPDRLPLYVVGPLLGYNIHDGVQLGLALHNRSFTPKKFEWLVAPLYGFKSSKLNGFGGGRYRIHRPFGGVQQILLSAGTQRWSDNTLALNDEAFGYNRSAGKIEFHFNDKPTAKRRSSAFVQGIYLNTERPTLARVDTVIAVTGTRNNANTFLRVGFESRYDKEITPLAYAITLEYKDRDTSIASAFESSHLRLDASVAGGYQYERGNFVRYRLFAGYFLRNDLRESASYPASSLSLVDNGRSDYRREGIYAGRNPGPGQNDWGDQQLGRRQGGFRAPVSAAFSNFQSNDYMVAANLDIDFPIKLPVVKLGAFVDAGYYSNRSTTVDPNVGTFSWVGGLSLTALDNRLGIYAPFVADPDTKLGLEQRGNLLERVSVRLQLESFLPWKWVDELL